MKFTAEQIKYLESNIEMVGLKIIQVKDTLYGDVKGHVKGTIYGDVFGDVKGYVLGGIWGPINSKEG